MWKGREGRGGIERKRELERETEGEGQRELYPLLPNLICRIPDVQEKSMSRPLSGPPSLCPFFVPLLNSLHPSVPSLSDAPLPSNTPPSLQPIKPLYKLTSKLYSSSLQLCLILCLRIPLIGHHQPPIHTPAQPILLGLFVILSLPCPLISFFLSLSLPSSLFSSPFRTLAAEQPVAAVQPTLEATIQEYSNQWGVLLTLVDWDDLQGRSFVTSLAKACTSSPYLPPSSSPNC